MNAIVLAEFTNSAYACFTLSKILLDHISSENTPSRFMLRKPGISTGLMGHLARMQTLPLLTKRCLHANIV